MNYIFHAYYWVQYIVCHPQNKLAETRSGCMVLYWVQLW